MSILLDDDGNELMQGKPLNVQALKVSAVCGVGLIACLGIGFFIGFKQKTALINDANNQETVKQCYVPMAHKAKNLTDYNQFALPKGKFTNPDQASLKPSKTTKVKVNYQDSAKWFYDIESNRMIKRTLK